MQEVIFTHYDKQYAKDFKRLNLEWIEKYFIVEAHDLEQLGSPGEYIIDKGGEILLAMQNQEVAGICALIKTGEEEFELAKMAVSPGFQGQQIGYKLGIYTIEAAKLLGAKRIWLESNKVLGAALNLYRKLGFREIPITVTPYARVDIRMELLVDRNQTGDFNVFPPKHYQNE